MSYDSCKKEYQKFLDALNNIRPLLWQNQYHSLNQTFEEYYKKWQLSNYDKYEETYENFLGLCQYNLFNNDSSLEEVYQKLTQWWNEAPSCYCAIMLAQFWTDMAASQRGTTWAKHVSPSEWSNAEIAKDTAFFWYISALHLEPKLPSVYNELLVLSGYLQIPFWLWKPEKLVNFNEHYNNESIDFYKNKYQLIPQKINLPQHMPAPSEAEFEYPPLYWFNRAIEISPRYLHIFRNYIHYLCPRWYGNEYKDIDNFLQLEICQNLPEEFYNALVVKKHLDFLSSYTLEVNIEFSNVEKIEYYANQYEELLNLKLLDVHKFELYSNLMFFYGNRVKNPINPSDHKTIESYIEKMFSIANIILEKYSFQLLDDNNTHGEFIEKLKWCINKENTYYQDKNNTLQRTLKLLNIRQKPASLVSILLHYYKGIHDPILSHEKASSFVEIIESPDASTLYGIDEGIDLIFQDHQHEAGLLLLENLSAAGHSQSSFILYNLYQGNNYYRLHKNPISKNLPLSAKWFDIAIKQKNECALLAWSLKESDQIKKLFKFNQDKYIKVKETLNYLVEIKFYTSYFIYIDVITKYGNKNEKELLFKETIPKIMYDARLNGDALSFLSQQYAIIFRENTVFKSNDYLVRMWLELAYLFSPDKEKLQLYNLHSKPQGLILAKYRFKKRMDNELKVIPDWIKPISSYFIERYEEDFSE